MIHEIEYLLSHYKGIKMFIFDDDIFTFDKEWIKAFSRATGRSLISGLLFQCPCADFDSETLTKHLKMPVQDRQVRA